MAPIEQITIAGFRGILAPLTLDFVKGSSPRSMAIYGRNGTGKSSITDAWEWFHTGRIEHLAREGARERSFPHRDSKSGETFVKVQFSGKELGTVRLNFDHSRVTMPSSQGDIERFRELVPHPCHVRFEDLTGFVYLTKTEKYDRLAGLMGFQEQVRVQKALQRVLRRLEEEVNSQEELVDGLESSVSHILEVQALSEATVYETLSEILEDHGIEGSSSVEGLEEGAERLTTVVQDDPRSQELADLSRLSSAVEETKLPSDLAEDIRSYLESARAFKRQEEKAVDLLLIDLYEQGGQILRAREERGEETQICPLCGNCFEGDLQEHIASELSRLKDLRESRDKLDRNRHKHQQVLVSLGDPSERLRRDCRGLEKLAAEWNLEALQEQSKEVAGSLCALVDLLDIAPQDLEETEISASEQILDTLEVEIERLLEERKHRLAQLKKRIKTLKEDTSRVQLVADYRRLTTALDQWKGFDSGRRRLKRLKRVHSAFEAVVQDYIASSIQNVAKRFDTISSDVEKYFAILEEHTECVGAPVLKLLPNQDRAVVLQVEFLGDPIYPAYRYLSESQLNSFGLAVFLASAKYFNQDFKFLILDDIINSFDGHKRPQVVKLLRNEFSSHQILLLTHDKMWLDRVSRVCPEWIRARFSKWVAGVGPIWERGLAPLDEIKEFIDRDKARIAGQMMGPYLECQLQRLCEAFHALVKYNRRNEFGLDTLLTRLRVRVGSKLGTGHDLYQAVQALENESGFRNFCAHWKDPSTEITPQEMDRVVQRWEVVENLASCSACHSFLEYDGHGFACKSAGCTTRIDKV